MTLSEDDRVVLSVIVAGPLAFRRAAVIAFELGMGPTQAGLTPRPTSKPVAWSSAGAHRRIPRSTSGP